MMTYRLKLGPRVIPYFKDSVSVCIEILRDEDDIDNSDEDASSSSTALNILQGLLSSIPKFWSHAELLQVVNLYLDIQSSDLSTFMKAVSKKAQSKVLLPLLSDTWLSLSTDRNEVGLVSRQSIHLILTFYYRERRLG